MRSNTSMKPQELAEFFQESLCIFDLASTDKRGALSEMVDCVSRECQLKDRELILEMVREQVEHHVSMFLNRDFGVESFSRFAGSRFSMSGGSSLRLLRLKYSRNFWVEPNNAGLPGTSR